MKIDFRAQIKFSHFWLKLFYRIYFVSFLRPNEVKNNKNRYKANTLVVPVASLWNNVSESAFHCLKMQIVKWDRDMKHEPLLSKCKKTYFISYVYRIVAIEKINSLRIFIWCLIDTLCPSWYFNSAWSLESLSLQDRPFSCITCQNYKSLISVDFVPIYFLYIFLKIH